MDGALSDNVAKLERMYLDENIWTKMGTLLSIRSGHRSTVFENTITHVGGAGIQ